MIPVMGSTSHGRWAAVVAVARSQVRRRLAAAVVLTIVVAGMAGLALALIAGSRRSGSALDRALSQRTPFDLQVSTEMPSADLAALPGVKRVVLNPYLALRVVRPDGTFSSLINGIGLDWDVITSFARVVRGRPSDGSDPFGVIVNEAAAQRFDVEPGADLVVRAFGLDQRDSVRSGDFTPTGPTYTFHVSAVYRSLQDLSADEVTGPAQMANLTQVIVPNTFYFAHGSEFLTYAEDYQIMLDDPSEADTFRSAFTTRSNELGTEVGPDSFGAPLLGGSQTSLRSPIRLETTLLLVLGLFAAGTTVVAETLLVRADQRVLSTDSDALRALGMTRGQLAAVAAVRVVPMGVLGALAAAGAAAGASALFPVGLGRLTEPTPGIELNLAVLGIGLVAIVVGVVSVGAAMGLASSNVPRPSSRLRARRAVSARTGLPVTAMLGARLAFDRGASRRTASPRQTVVVGAVSVALVLGVGAYLAGLSHLHGDRAAHGFPWDAMVGNVNFPLDAAQLADLRDDSNIVASARVAALERSGLDQTHLVSLWAQDTSVTAVGVEALRGRMPTSNNEIALGARTLESLGRDVGDTVSLTVAPDSPATSMTIVGVVLLPSAEEEIGSGALITLDGLAAVVPDLAPQFMVIRLRDGVDRSAAIARLIAHHDNAVMLDVRPAQIANLWRVRWLPLLGAVTVALLGAVLVWYTLAAAARARAREIAVLRSLGMTPDGIRSIVVWQGLLIAGSMLVLGVPIGLVSGAFAWRSIAQPMGVDSHAVVSPLVVLVLPVVVGISVLAAYMSARRDRRASVASVLRAE